MNDKVANIVCVRQDKLRSSPPQGSRLRPCAVCGNLVWLSPASVGAVPTGLTIRLNCIECAAAQFRASGEVPLFAPMTEDQREEIARATGASDERISEIEAQAPKVYFPKEVKRDDIGPRGPQ